MKEAISIPSDMSASVVIRVLFSLYDLPADPVAESMGLGLRFTNSQGITQCVYTGSAMFISYIGYKNALTQDAIIDLCKRCKSVLDRNVDLEGDTCHALTQGLHAMYSFLIENQGQLNLAHRIEKLSKYYNNIFVNCKYMSSPFALEDRLTKAVARGDEALALKTLREINSSGEKAVLANDPVRSAKNSMIGSIAFLSRAAIQAGVNANDAFAVSDALIQQVEEMKSQDTLLAFEEKIQEPCYFVRHTKYTLSEIASLYSYSSQSYYITVFKKVMGMTPMEYRKQYTSD